MLAKFFLASNVLTNITAAPGKIKQGSRLTDISNLKVEYIDVVINGEIQKTVIISLCIQRSLRDVFAEGNNSLGGLYFHFSGRAIK